MIALLLLACTMTCPLFDDYECPASKPVAIGSREITRSTREDVVSGDVDAAADGTVVLTYTAADGHSWRVTYAERTDP